jgi:hypothetical protein
MTMSGKRPITREDQDVGPGFAIIRLFADLNCQPEQ